MSNTVKVWITGGLILAAIVGIGWRFGGLARAKKSAQPDQHRASASPCASTRPPGETNQREGGDCKSDADCKAGKNGRCMALGGGRMAPQNRCTYDACFTDNECGPKQTCNCEHQGNYCLPGNCRVDADCGNGGFCSPSWALCSLHGPYRPNGYYCHTSSDECMRDEDCPRPKKEHYGPLSTRCAFSQPVGRWVCMSEECPVG